MQGEPLAEGLKTPKPTKMDENELKKKLDAIRKRGSIIPTSNTGQEKSSVNSTQVAMNQVQQKKLQVAGKTISLCSQRQDDTNLPNSGSIPQVEVEDQEDTLEIDKSEQGKGKP
ncbi:hypothetical protein PIB30_115351, partial [Stylosanthes scabra]|nr:hypothetical protein [Stylosanthes scabra]